MSGFTPANQVRLTNVATVRLQKKGKRFEIACYRNKVLSWRNKLETDIKEVLQIGTVFTNVSKGMLASSKDLIDAFGTAEQMIVCQEILEKGEMQVSEQERVALHETVFRDIASIVAEKTVNPNNNLPYTITMIQNAMRQIQFSVNLSKSSKSQALEVIRKLKDIMPITRASMLIRIVYGISDQSAVANEIDKIGGQIVQKSPSLSDTKEECYVDVRIDPEYYRRIEDLVKDLGFGRVEVIQMRMAGAVAPGNVSAMVLLGGDAVSIPSLSGQDTKEGDDVDYSRSTSMGDSKATTANNNKPKADKAKSGKGRSKNAGDDLNGLLAQVGLNDLKNTDSDEESFDEYLVVNASKSKKKAKKGKTGKFAAEPARSGSDVDEVDDEGEDDHEESVSIAESASVATTNVSTTATAGNTAKQKVSKKEKRIEKELQKEREEQARALQDRLLRQKKEQLERQQQQLSTVENISSADSSKNVESNTIEDSHTVTASPATTVSTSVPLPSSADTGASAASALSGKVQSCNTCGGIFYDSKLYRDHFKSDWHRFNLKRKMKNLPPVTSEEEFMNLPLSELQLT